MEIGNGFSRVDANSHKSGQCHFDVEEEPTVLVLDEYILTAVFGNDIVFSKIANYLFVPDLKILRQTCKLLLTQINTHRNFMDSLKLTITGEAIEENVISGTTFPWKNVHIRVSTLKPEHFITIQTHLPQVENIELRYLDLEMCHLDWIGLGGQHYDRASEIAAATWKLLPRFTSLKSLTLDLNYLFFDMPDCEILQGVVGSLETFCLCGEFLRVYDLDPKSVSELRNLYKINVEKIGGLDWKLKAIEIEGLGGIAGEDNSSAVIQNILRSSSNTLEKIIAKCVMHDIGELDEFTFPCLKSIHFNFGGNGSDFVPFLLRQPDLENIALKAHRWHIPLETLDAIRRKSSKLRSLLLKGQGWLERYRDPRLWSFLTDLEDFREFHITGKTYFPSREANCSSMAEPCLLCLPSTMEKIHLRFMHSNQAGDYWEQRTILTLARFAHLIELKIEDSSRVLNDNILQCICRELSRLRVFHFGWSGDVTDFGLTGERKNELFNTGVSLKNLKGLWELRVQECENITAEGLIKSVHFQELRRAYFRFRSGVCISDDQLVQIAKNNPSLEFVMRTMENVPDRCIFERIKGVNVRLTRIRSENKRFWNWDPVSSQGTQFPVSYRPSYGLVGNSARRFKMKSVQSETPDLAYYLVPKMRNSKCYCVLA